MVKRYVRGVVRVLAAAVSIVVCTMGCRFSRGGLDPYRCEAPGGCAAPAQCIDGFCVIPMAGTDATGTDAAGTDAMGTDAAGTDAAGTDAGTDAGPMCGDSTCDCLNGEDCLTCAGDCGPCNPSCNDDGTCDTTGAPATREDCIDCPMDCGPCTGSCP